MRSTRRTAPTQSAGVALITGIALLRCAAVSAQWSPSFTASLGRGYGSIALSQSILQNTRERDSRAPANATGSPGRGEAGTGVTAGTGTRSGAGVMSGADAPTLVYTADPAVSDRVRSQMITALSQQLPQLRAQMEHSFAGNTVLKEFDRRVAARGYSSRNVADAMAELLVVSWEISTDSAAGSAQIQGAHQQVRDIFLGNSRLRTMTDAERQEMAERIAYQVVISSSAHTEYVRSGDQAQLADLRQSVAAMLLQQGIDLSHLRLTAQGFHRAH